jgi:hypothetical protein
MACTFGQLPTWTHSGCKGIFAQTPNKTNNNLNIWQEGNFQFTYEEASRNGSEVILNDLNGRTGMQVKLSGNACFWKYQKDVAWNLLYNGTWVVHPSNANPFTSEQNCQESRTKYLEKNLDVKNADLEPWIHYLVYGKKEGRKWESCQDQIVEIAAVNNLAVNKSAIVVSTCIDNDVNNKGTLYLVTPSGKRTVLNNMSTLDSDPFFHNGLKFMLDQQTQLVGCINTDGNWVIQPQFNYELGTKFSDGAAPVSTSYKFGYIDTLGNWIIRPEYQNSHGFNGGIAMSLPGETDDQGAWIWINKKNEKVADWRKILFSYTFQGQFALATDKLKDSKKYGIFSIKDMKWITPLIFEIDESGNRNMDQNIPLFPVGQSGKMGFVGIDGKIKIPCKYDKVCAFSEGLAAVKVNNKWGFIDKDGKMVLEAKYDLAGSFMFGKAYVDNHFIDKKGVKQSFVFPEDYKSYWEWEDFLDVLDWNDAFVAAINQYGDWDVMNWKGEIIWKGECFDLETCFPAGSDVTLYQGVKKPIEEVKVGDELSSYTNGQTIPTKVIEIQQHTLVDEEVMEIIFEEKSPLYASIINPSFIPTIYW